MLEVGAREQIEEALHVVAVLEGMQEGVGDERRIVVDTVAGAEEARELGLPRPGEGDSRGRAAELDRLLLVDEWVALRSDRPFVTAERLRAAAERLRALDSVDGDGRLGALVAALELRAGIAHALRGEVTTALPPLEAGARTLEDGETAAAILAANAWLCAGDRAAARRALGAAKSPGALAPWHGLLSAELALPDRQAAKSHLEAAKLAAARVDASRVGERLRWLTLATDPAPAAPAALPPRLPLVGPPALPQTEAARATLLEELLGVWSSWLTASSEARRAHRYTLFRNRGDAPDALAAYLLLAGRLVDEPAEIEPWLDAALARDLPRFSLRAVALARWRAAAWRGDEAAAELWRGRFTTLARLAERQDTAELNMAARL